MFMESGYVVYSLKMGVFYLLMIVFLWAALMGAGVLVSQKDRLGWGKLTAFECGFDPLSTTRTPFSMRFFLLALLFLVFDVEVILLLPFVFSIKIMWLKAGVLMKMLYFSLLLVLFLGLAHEYNEGSLDWEFES